MGFGTIHGFRHPLGVLEHIPGQIRGDFCSSSMALDPLEFNQLYYTLHNIIRASLRKPRLVFLCKSQIIIISPQFLVFSQHHRNPVASVLQF